MPKVLLATAHQMVRDRFTEALSLDGHSFAVCHTGEAVEAALRRDLPDIVIADVDLPGLDAFELVGMLTTVAAGRPIPPVVMRSNETTEDGEDGHFVFMGGSDQPEDLRALVRARLAAADTALKHGRILIADDDWSLRKSLQVRLQKEGYEVLTAMDGLEAFERLSDVPDLVLTDVDMPGLDGLVQRMRSTADYREIPVIIMTAHTTAGEEAAEGLKLGANDYVRKPFDWQELSARVQTQLRIREISRLTAEKQRDLAIIELAGAAAHEINNPLAVIMARLELVLSELDEADSNYKSLEQVDHLVHRTANVVQKMSQVRRYQVQNYCGGVNILDLDGASADEEDESGETDL